MGTKLEYAINVLGKNQCVNDWGRFQNRDLREGIRNSESGFHKFQEHPVKVMDRGSNPVPNNPTIESIKKTMQMHEDIFKQQVRELHRLYSVQRMLMGEVKKQTEHTRIWSPLPATSSSETNFINWPNQTLQIPTTDPTKIPGNLDLGRPCKEDTDDDRSDPRNCSGSRSMEEDEVELTLSIGGATSEKKPKRCVDNKFFKSSASIESDRGGPPAPDNSGSTETSNRERKRPFWLF